MSFRPSQEYVLGSDGLNPPFLVTVRPVPLTDGSGANFLLFKGRGYMPWKLGSLRMHHCRGPLPPYDFDQV